MWKKLRGNIVNIIYLAIDIWNKENHTQTVKLRFCECECLYSIVWDKEHHLLKVHSQGKKDSQLNYTADESPFKAVITIFHWRALSETETMIHCLDWQYFSIHNLAAAIKINRNLLSIQNFFCYKFFNFLWRFQKGPPQKEEISDEAAEGSN